MDRTHKERLLKLARLLEENAKKKKGVKFDLGMWGVTYVVERIKEQPKVKLTCNTTACAVGLAAISGKFEGLDYVLLGHGISLQIEPKYGGYRGWDAVLRYFDLNMDEGSKLFTTQYYPEKYWAKAVGERFVAKRIRYFVKHGDFPPSTARY